MDTCFIKRKNGSVVFWVFIFIYEDGHILAVYFKYSNKNIDK